MVGRRAARTAGAVSGRLFGPLTLSAREWLRRRVDREGCDLAARSSWRCGTSGTYRTDHRGWVPVRTQRVPLVRVRRTRLPPGPTTIYGPSSRPGAIDELLALAFRRPVPLLERYARRRRLQARPQRLLHRLQHGWVPLATHGLAVEVVVELNDFRPALAATEAPMGIPPFGRLPATCEDVERVADRDGAVVTAGTALDD